MDNNDLKRALNGEQGFNLLNNEQSINNLAIIPLATGPSVFLSSEKNYSRKEEDELYTPSDSLLQEQDISTSSNNKKYRIHVGTQPGFYTKDHIVFEQSQFLHSRIVNVLELLLENSNTNAKLIKKDVFSMSRWGLEPYTSISLSCSNEMAYGWAAIIGLALRQDAIGVYNDDSLPHRIFTVSSSCNATISNRKALKLMKKITKKYEYLSAQFDESGQLIQFHDFEDKYKEQRLIEQLQIDVNKYFENDLFVVKESISKSNLLEKKEYDEAIIKSICRIKKRTKVLR